MFQFYFLAIIVNLLAGIALSIEYIQDKASWLSMFKDFFTNNNFRLTLGILAFIVGIFKLLSVVEDDIPVVGDIFPALAGIVMGLTLASEYYKGRSTVSSPTVDFIDRALIKNKTAVGIAGIISAALHFIFPKILLL
ncbi:MAG: hypothetical protein DRP87_09440 [Spirochaetes bacterium]|nr:MAG: hypothetical protein DRP87_09440 [Spirochaetota bacterium]